MKTLVALRAHARRRAAANNNSNKVASGPVVGLVPDGVRHPQPESIVWAALVAELLPPPAPADPPAPPLPLELLVELLLAPPDYSGDYCDFEP